MKYVFSMALLTLAISGCESFRSTENGEPARDNTAVNTRDQDSATQTPLDQNENQEDVNLTAKIRQQVVDANLSINARNIKIISQGGRVTLRGPVESAEEKSKIEALARASAGEGNVDSQLEVKQNPIPN
jgi:osmotically-inducible protein OsmY